MDFRASRRWHSRKHLYGGNPLGTAVAAKILEIINTPEILSNVIERGQQLMNGLNQLNLKHELFKTIRGRGLLIGAVLRDQYSGRAGELSALAMQEGLMTLVAGPDVHRFAPPLIISEAQIVEALDYLDAAYTRFVG